MKARRLLRLLLKTPGRLWRTTMWALGRRQYPWTLSPSHWVLGTLSRRVYARPAARYRLAYNVLAGLLKFRERVHADKMNFVARLQGPTTGEVLRNVALWQYTILQNREIAPTLKVHGVLRLCGDPEQVQLDRILSLLLEQRQPFRISQPMTLRSARARRPYPAVCATSCLARSTAPDTRTARRRVLAGDRECRALSQRHPRLPKPTQLEHVPGDDGI